MIEHAYLSTACHHELHDRCRKLCKFCDNPCVCKCHEKKPGDTEVQIMVGVDDLYITAPIYTGDANANEAKRPLLDVARDAGGRDLLVRCCHPGAK
jgi:hypothetical protein